MSHTDDSAEKKGLMSDEAKKNDFISSVGLTTREADVLLEKWGRNELPEQSTPKWRIFLDQLIAPMPILIWIGAFTELAIENYLDMGILFGIQFTNASLGFYEITKADDAVAALKKQLKPEATVKRDGKWSTMDATAVVPGDLVLLASGSAVPADCLVNDGRIEVDQSAMTGESLAVTMYRGDCCKMGSLIQRGEVEGTVLYTGKLTFFGKTAGMLQGPVAVGNLQKVLIRIMIVLTLLSFLLSGIVFGFLLHQKENISAAVSFTVVLIVASIPIAIEIVCTTTLALGSKELVKHGAIVKRLAAIEDMAGMNMLCSDKTGTLTKNKMEIQKETPIYLDGEDQHSMLRYAAMASKWHEPARDALDTMTHNAADLLSLDTGPLAVKQTDYMPFDPTVKRTEGTLTLLSSGQVFKTTKGAPHVLLKLCEADNADQSKLHALTEKIDADIANLAKRGVRSMAVAKTNVSTGKWEMVGLLTFLDPPREDTKATIARSVELGVEVKMITGDHLLIAMETAKMLDLGNKVAGSSIVVPNIRGPDGLPMLDPVTSLAPLLMKENFGDYIRHGHGFAQVFPEHKFLIVECLRDLGFRVGMTGDGVNDAPALHAADVGIAVADSTDAAKASADIVLTEEGLSTIVEGIVIARCIFQRMKNFITYRIAATLQLLVFFFIAVIWMQPRKYQPDFILEVDEDLWPRFFKLPVLMLMLITLLNDGTLISIGYDNVIPSKLPNVWNLRVVFSIASLLALVALISSLLILHWGLDSWNEGSVFQKIGLGGLEYGQIATMMYLKVSISDFLTLFSSRTDGFFWSSMPSPILLIAASCALLISTLLACYWPKKFIDNQWVSGLNGLLPLYVWIYCVICWIIQDVSKVILVYFLTKFNIFGINDTSVSLIDGPAKSAAPTKTSEVELTEKSLLSTPVAQVARAIGYAEEVLINYQSFKKGQADTVVIPKFPSSADLGADGVAVKKYPSSTMIVLNRFSSQSSVEKQSSSDIRRELSNTNIGREYSAIKFKSRVSDTLIIKNGKPENV